MGQRKREVSGEVARVVRGSVTVILLVVEQYRCRPRRVTVVGPDTLGHDTLPLGRDGRSNVLGSGR